MQRYEFLIRCCGLVKFLIFKNKNYTNQINLEEFIYLQKQETEVEKNSLGDMFDNETSDIFEMLGETFNITKAKAELWYDYSLKVLGFEANEIDVSEYIRQKTLLYKNAKANGKAKSEKWLDSAIRDNYK